MDQWEKGLAKQPRYSHSPSLCNCSIRSFPFLVVRRHQQAPTHGFLFVGSRTPAVVAMVRSGDRHSFLFAVGRHRGQRCTWPLLFLFPFQPLFLLACIVHTTALCDNKRLASNECRRHPHPHPHCRPIDRLPRPTTGRNTHGNADITL